MQLDLEEPTVVAWDGEQLHVQGMDLSDEKLAHLLTNEPGHPRLQFLVSLEEALKNGGELQELLEEAFADMKLYERTKQFHGISSRVVVGMLTLHPSPVTRASALLCDNCPAEIMARLARDPSAVVRMQLLYRPDLPAAIRERMLGDADEAVRLRAAETLSEDWGRDRISGGDPRGLQ